MKLENLYQENISRRINPAVVVNEMDSYSVNQEIREYVFTKELIKNLYRLLKVMSQPDSGASEGKTGVWVNGYYGSGKSHFIKYLYYCLQENTRNQAIDRVNLVYQEEIGKDSFFEPTPSEVKTITKNLAATQIETIIFNIDVKSQVKSDKEVITRVFLNMLNKHRGYNDTNIALSLDLEKTLDKAGKFDAFKEKILKDLGDQWDGNQRRFIRSSLGAVLGIAKELHPTLDEDSLRHAIKHDGGNEAGYRVEDLIEEFKDFLTEKEDSYRLVFLVDEVSQYIGANTSLLLNLQSIIEELGVHCGRQIWIVCTAQQELGFLIDNTASKGEDFGKILGRFETRVSLDSQDVSLITKKRILTKKPEGMEVLTQLYKQNKGAIDNQFFFENDLYDGYPNDEDFYLTYPFVPYQFQLISDVFESFSRAGYVGEGVRNTERSILGITHFTAKLAKEEELGYFIPFDLFFNQELEKDLTHFARGLITRAYGIKKVKEDPFARRVVNALFMVSNLNENQKKQFPANLDNLAVLLLDKLDQGKMDLQNGIQAVLDELVSQNVIQESEGTYRFLKEEEIEVANAITHTPLNLNDTLTAIQDNLIKSFLRLNRRVDLGSNSYDAKISVDEKELFPKGDIAIRFSIMDQEEINQLALKVSDNELIFCLHPWFTDDQAFRNDFNRFTRTNKFLKENSDRVAGSRADILQKFGKANEVLLKSLKGRFEKAFLEASVISAKQEITSGQFATSSAAKKYEDAVQHHLAEVYKKQPMAADYASSKEELMRQARADVQLDMRGLTPAEEEVNNRLGLMHDGIVLDEVIKHYQKPPFGWKDLAIIDVLIRLGQYGKRKYEWKSAEIHDWKELASRAGNSNERKSIRIFKGAEISIDDVRDFVKQVNRVFNETLLNTSLQDPRSARDEFQQKLKLHIASVNKWKEASAGMPFARRLGEWHTQLVALLEEREIGKLFQTFREQERDLRDQRDQVADLGAFIEEQLPKYIKVREFERENRKNFDILDEVAQDRARKLRDYLEREVEPAGSFPHALSLFAELSKDLTGKITTIRAEVVQQYETSYALLEQELMNTCQELGVEYNANLLLPKGTKLSRMSASIDLSFLQSQQVLVSEFEQEQRKKIAEYEARVLRDRHEEEARKAREQGTPTPAPLKQVSTAPYSVRKDRSLPRKISNEAELELFLSKVDQNLRQLLKEGKTIIIE